MNEATISRYTLKDVEEGFRKTFKVNITESMVSEFARITGDYSPMHMDEEYAHKTEFKHRICHGMLVGSFLSRLVGMHLPGENGLLLLLFIQASFTLLSESGTHCRRHNHRKKRIYKNYYH